MSPELFPAIDLRAGRVVRLTKGDYEAETVYDEDPVIVARRFAADGATWIHIVDLDAARSGEPVNREVITRIVATLRSEHPGCRVQTGGGVRAFADVEALAAAGVTRVVMGSAAVADPDLVTRASAVLPVAVGLDHREGRLAVHGWTTPSEMLLSEALQSFPRASAFVITDIGRDGMLSGPDLRGLSEAVRVSPVPVIASGGVATLDDLRLLGRLEGLAGVITGKALYEGRFSVREASAALASDTEQRGAT